MHVHFDLAIIEQPALFAAWLVYTALLCLIYYACIVREANRRMWEIRMRMFANKYIALVGSKTSRPVTHDRCFFFLGIFMNI